MDEKQPVKRIDREKRAEEKLNIREGKYFLNGEDGQKKSQNLKITLKENWWIIVDSFVVFVETKILHPSQNERKNIRYLSFIFLSLFHKIIPETSLPDFLPSVLRPRFTSFSRWLNKF